MHRNQNKLLTYKHVRDPQKQENLHAPEPEQVVKLQDTKCQELYMNLQCLEDKTFLPDMIQLQQTLKKEEDEFISIHQERSFLRTQEN